MISLQGKSAVITGGSRGIGAATVKMFAEAGADVVFNYYRSREAAREVERAAQKHGTQVAGVKAEVSRMRDAKSLVESAVKRFGRVDILVANAGIWNAEDLPIEQMTEKQWDEMLRINVKGVYSVIHYAVPPMIEQRSGRIIAISSTAGQRGEALHSHYGASKGAIISLVRGLSTELAPHNILVNCVAPGWVDTDMARPALEKASERRKVLATIPLGRIAKPEE